MSTKDVHVEKQLDQAAKPKQAVKSMEWDFEAGDMAMHTDGAKRKPHEDIELPINWEDIPLP